MWLAGLRLCYIEKLTTSPNIGPGDVRDSFRAAGPEGISSDEEEPTHRLADY